MERDYLHRYKLSKQIEASWDNKHRCQYEGIPGYRSHM
jgi:hypothetical protein